MAAINKFLKGKTGRLNVINDETSINIVPESGRIKVRVTFSLEENDLEIADSLEVDPNSNEFAMAIGDNLHEINVDHDLNAVYKDGTGKLYFEIKVSLDPTKVKDRHG